MVNVDDLLFFSKTKGNRDVEEFKQQLSGRFTVKFEIEVKDYLGLQLVQDESGILVHQTDYCLKILELCKWKDIFERRDLPFYLEKLP